MCVGPTWNKNPLRLELPSSQLEGRQETACRVANQTRLTWCSSSKPKVSLHPPPLIQYLIKKNKKLLGKTKGWDSRKCSCNTPQSACISQWQCTWAQLIYCENIMYDCSLPWKSYWQCSNYTEILRGLHMESMQDPCHLFDDRKTWKTGGYIGTLKKLHLVKKLMTFQYGILFLLFLSIINNVRTAWEQGVPWDPLSPQNLKVRNGKETVCSTETLMDMGRRCKTLYSP